MPNVPFAPGVPALSSFAPGQVALLVADVIGAILPPPVWGIFLDGEPVIAADNTVTLDFRQDAPISDYPVEPNSFMSYNKVQLPADLRVRVSAGGSLADRQAFLASIDAVMNTTDLYDVVTPEQTYTDYCFSHRDFRRAARNGQGLISVDLWLTQVRQTSSATFTSTQQPGDAGQVGKGNVQPQAPTPAQQTTLTSPETVSAWGGGL